MVILDCGGNYRIFAIRGWNRGLLRILYSLISVVLLIGLISYATPYVTSYIKENTGVYTLLQERCTQALKNRGESTIEEKRRNKPVIQKWQVYPSGACYFLYNRFWKCTAGSGRRL